jgi:sugar phosphate isomerase/epimerase
VADRLRCALYFAAEIGATQIVIHSPFTTFGSPYIPYSDPDRHRQELNMAHTVLGALLPLAQQLGCVFVIENIYDTNPELLLELVASFHSPWVRMSLDVGHAFITQQIGGPPPDHWIRAAAPFLAHIHLHDTDGQADRHWAVGQGSIKWRAIFAELSRLPDIPRLILEMKQPNDIQRSVEWLYRKGYVDAAVA